MRSVSRRTTTPDALSIAPGARAVRMSWSPLRELMESKWAPRITREGEEPGMRTMMEGWLNAECGNWVTVMEGLGSARDFAVVKSQVADSVPKGDW